MKSYGDVEKVTLRYVQFCCAKISSHLKVSEDKSAAISTLTHHFLYLGFVSDNDIYRKKIISIYRIGRKYNKPLDYVIRQMEHYREAIADHIGVMGSDLQWQPIYDSSVFIRDEREKLRAIVLYFAHRFLVVQLIRMRLVREGRIQKADSGNSTPTPAFHVLYSGDNYRLTEIPEKLLPVLFAT